MTTRQPLPHWTETGGCGTLVASAGRRTDEKKGAATSAARVKGGNAQEVYTACWAVMLHCKICSRETGFAIGFPYRVAKKSGGEIVFDARYDIKSKG
ncbi:MAG: hypothetical protein RIE83_04080 [Thalassobaculaceae bacterium]